ncbi:MAG: acyl-CoA thioesterase [Xanthomonadales bacterium]|jgi:acyl-CoA hydrolase|uniref:acyl-CoA thioesterase n=1 Tax=Dokdonella sp. TaxID=2291710 RepID=UPI002D1B4509|nr:acyl-CoA thioesterase [Xanthomonadales bacterium]HQV73141.1 acyl-CoA thioesterase [Dokdonella sp.]MBK7013248.1 acyl-CoA thioesterase [Xanthomonadales bacterium]MBK7211593.1 acyl-CoA thioesterase [Xanthomonadales bacterium]MBL0221244.1 acyl-CoA thioesterase [Xanthomonadales bacterium]
MPGTQRELELQFLAEPTDVNFGGKMHGGAVLRWIDQAGYACAVAWSGKYCVTAAVGGIEFVAPILIGDLVQVRCKLVHTGTSSMQITVDVIARDLKTARQRLATHCVMTFVALDAPDGKPSPVPRWTPLTEEDIALGQYALKVMEVGRRIREEAATLRPGH